MHSHRCPTACYSRTCVSCAGDYGEGAGIRAHRKRDADREQFWATGVCVGNQARTRAPRSRSQQAAIAMQDIRTLLKDELVIGDGGYLIELERRGYVDS